MVLLARISNTAAMLFIMILTWLYPYMTLV